MTIEKRAPKSRLVIGCGYLGMRVARLWKPESVKLFALTRRLENAERFRGEGWSPLVGDLCGDLPPWPPVDTVLLAVGFDRSSGHAIEDVYVEGVRRVLGSLPDAVQRVVYISSTGVYGAAAGDSVDEETPCRPNRPGGAACLEAERLLAESRFADRHIVLRLAGIYGPQRLPRLKQIAEGAPIPANPDGYLNLIHVDDAARIVVAVEQQVSPPALFCVSDNSPVLRGEFLREAARAAGLPEPTFEPADANSDRRGGDKRVCSDRLYEALDITLQYPTYREGLAQAVGEEPAN